MTDEFGFTFANWRKNCCKY